MRVEVMLQPYPTYRRLYDCLTQWLRSPAIDHFIVIAAWANHRGLARLAPDLHTFRKRGGRAKAILGIDEGGATAQGLRLAATAFDDSAVFHSNDTRTFHPKLYIAKGSTEAHVFVGSNNLTPGGLFHNFEAGLLIDLDLRSPDDSAFLAAVEATYSVLINDSAVAKSLPPLLNTIMADPAFRIRDEAEPRRTHAGRPSEPDADSVDPFVAPLFGRSRAKFLPAVEPGDPIPGLRTRRGTGCRAAAPALVPRRPSPASPMTVPVLKRWFRELDSTAAQRPPKPSSHPTGNLRLSRAGHPINQTIYFRNEFFDRVAWVGTGTPRGVREQATVRMELVVDGRPLGVFDLEVSHATWRIAGQSNIPTVLHWGPLFAMLRATDYTGRTVTIERFQRGKYRLTIDVARTGPFVR